MPAHEAVPQRKKYPDSRLYLVHGNAQTEVSTVRFELVHQLLTPEERDTGLTEIESAGNQPLRIDRALSEILEELGTSSFIAGSRRVAVIYDLQELFGSSGGRKKAPARKKPAKTTKAKAPAKRDRMEVLCEWLRDVLPGTENIAIFVCTESDEKRRTVSKNGPLYRLAQEMGVIIERSEKPVNFEFENHLLSGNPTAALTMLREWLKRAGSDSGSRLRIYSTIAGVVQLTFEAKMAQLGREKGIPVSHIMAEGAYPRLNATPDFKARKFHDLARRLSVETILELMERTNKLQKLLYPSGEEDYVAGWEDQAEVLILQLCTGAKSGFAALR